VFIRKFDPDSLIREYGESCIRVAPPAGYPEPPFGAMWGAVDPGETSTPNTHHEAEVFFILSGQGEVEVDGLRHDLRSGDAVYLEPFESHALRNGSPDSDLRFLSVWWEDRALLERSERRGDSETDGRSPSRVLVTATPPTVNGGLHLGHISGPYLAADVYRRYLRMRGCDAYYVTGSDENQSYVVTKAAQRGWTPEETAARFGDEVARALGALRIEPDVFARPSTSPHHERLCREFFSRLYANGALELRATPALHCVACDRYLFEAHVSGLCPHCGHGSDGCACEDCGRPNDCVDLIDPRCTTCGSAPIVREVSRLYFPLGRYEKQLRRYLRTVAMAPHLAALCEEMLSDGLPDIAASHVADWGIPVPVTGLEDQVIYVWLEMCPGYLAASQQVSDAEPSLRGFEDLWKDPEAEVVQFFGFDNGYFHALLFPALLMAYDPDMRLPSALVVNEFYLLEGEKFSSSREHAIWAADFAGEQPADCVRLYLAMDRPEHERTSFTLADYEAWVRAELSGRWEPWLVGLGRRVLDECEGLAPATGTYTPAHAKLFRTITSLIRRAEDALEAGAFSPSEVVQVLGELVSLAQRFGVAESRLSRAPERSDERRTALALELAAARALATMAAPLVPELAQQLWTALGFEGEGPARWERRVAFLAPGQDVSGLLRVSLPQPVGIASESPRP